LNICRLPAYRLAGSDVVRGRIGLEAAVVREELWAWHEPRGAQYMGVNWVGPAVMRHGTAEQKARHLAPIAAAGDVIWCQGFSEPEAGSDLASLRTRAVPSGDGWLVSGQKVWTSYATMASWCVLAAATDPSAPKSRSPEVPKSRRLTIFLVPMDRNVPAQA
jgi:alkylation response protein AidB-like acyl-CoA dehydrogenase